MILRPYKDADAIREMVKRQEDMKVPTELLPTCPHCSKPMTMNLRFDDTSVAKNPNATYVCINQGQAVCPQEIERQPICIDMDIGDTLSAVAGKSY